LRDGRATAGGYPARLVEDGALAIAHALEIARLSASLEAKQPRGGRIRVFKIGVRDVGAGKIRAGEFRPG
jgi:hypothetical protein